MNAIDLQVLEALPTHPVQRMPFLAGLPVTLNRNSVIGALGRLMDAGLVCRPERGLYALTDAGRAYRAGTRGPLGRPEEWPRVLHAR